MRENPHERARRLIVLADDGLGFPEQRWLHTHLAQCADCQRYAAAVSGVAAELRRGAQLANFALLEQTTRRVRSGARDWQQRREQVRLVHWSLVATLLFIAVALRISWSAFTYVGVRLGYPHAAVQASFTYFWLIPTVVAGVAIVIGSSLLSQDYRVPMEARQ